MDKCIAWYTGVKSNKKIWVSDFNYNALFQIDEETGVVTFVGRFPEEDISQELHLESFIKEKNIYYLPQHIKSVSVYDVENERFSSIKLKTGLKGYSTIVGAYSFDEDIYWLIPRYLDIPIQALSTKNNSIIKEIDISNFAKKLGVYDNEILYSCKSDKQIYLAAYGTNIIIVFDKDEEKFYEKRFTEIQSLSGAIKYCSDSLWFFADESLYRWKIDEDSIEQVIGCSCPKNNTIEWIECDRDKKKLVCCPRWVGDIVIVDILSYKSKTIGIDDLRLHSNMDMNWTWRDFKQFSLDGNILEIYPLRFKEKISIDILTSKIVTKTYSYPQGLNLFANRLSFENDRNTLKDFIGFLCN